MPFQRPPAKSAPKHESLPETSGTSALATKATVPGGSNGANGRHRELTDYHRDLLISFRPTHAPVKPLPFRMTVPASAVLHILTPALTALFLFLLVLLLGFLMHFNPWDWFKKEPRARDLEYVIVQDRHEKRPDNAKKKGSFNQLAGGKEDPKKDLAPVENPTPPVHAPAQKPQQATPKAAPAAKPTPPTPKQVAAKPTPQPQKQPPQKQPDKQPPMPTPKVAAAIPIPAKSQATPKTAQQSPNGPVATTRPNPAQQGNPAPRAIAMNSPSSAGMNSMGSTGNPQKGASSRQGVDVMADADMGPYMAEVKRRMQRNWRPPRGDKTKRVVVYFEIGRDGRLLNVDVDESSGDKLADEAAKNAVTLSAPFKPLPPAFQDNTAPILFTFDYTIYGSSR